MAVSKLKEVILHLIMQTDYGVLTVSKKTDQTYHLRADSLVSFCHIIRKKLELQKI